MSPVDIGRLVEASQHQRIGTYLLSRSEKRMEIRTKQLLDRYDKKFTSRMAMVRKDTWRALEWPSSVAFLATSAADGLRAASAGP